MPINPSELQFFENMARQQAEKPSKPLEDTSLAEARADVSTIIHLAGPHADAPYQDFLAPARDSYQIPVRIYNNHLDSNIPIFFYCMGNAYIFPLFKINSIVCSRIAQYSNAKIAIINPRFAPEYPLPTQINDTYDATAFIANNSQKFNINPDKILLGGYSFGAACALNLAIFASETKAFKLQHLILVNGLYNLHRSNKEFVAYQSEDKSLTDEIIDYVIQQLGIKPEEYSSTLYSPYFYEFTNLLPPTTIVTGEYDRVRGTSEALFNKMQRQHCEVEKIVMPGQTHNTMLLRGVMTDGQDPAEIIGNIIKQHC